MKKNLSLFLLFLMLEGNSLLAYAENQKKNQIPEIRESLDEKRAQLLIVLATDLMFVRHFAADRLYKLKELEINVSLQPFNEKQKEVFAVRKKQMDECYKEAISVQNNFFVAFDQLNTAKYEVSDYKAIYAYAKKNSQEFMKKDLMTTAELKSYEDSRPQGFPFRSVCIDDGVAPKTKEKTEFVAPGALSRK